MQTLHDWEVFAKLEAAFAWEAEWLRILEVPRPVLRFRPADVVAIPLRGVEPRLFWSPTQNTRRKSPGGRAAQMAEEAWAEAAEAAVIEDMEMEGVSSEECEPEEEEGDAEDAVPPNNIGIAPIGVCV